MLMRKVNDERLKSGYPPYAGITLTRFTGMISDRTAHWQHKHPGTL